ncbi:DUF3159 domain-containing protein [Streptomyces sp. N2-109]|uniref:DUF3159 domain-containing protein n=1 Tax=Streptomyces gossypii TaxID=2883101 RepID=A0ABT2JS12_9ACTN|nr:DUF3159 domain-containing protein [Streptomyces gossypii]MCT2590663.1 DUF3159 domain-containing protein [Streptomyces gossypii]
MTSLDKPARAGQDAPTDEAGGDSPAGRAASQAALLEAFGGLRGLVETTVPGLVFILMFTIDKDLKTSAIAALVLSGLLGLARLLRKDTLKHAFGGVFGVGVGVVFAMMTGNAKDFYLPGMLYGLGLALAYLITAAAGVPLLGLILGPAFKENLSWRTRNPGRKRAYVKASYAWGFIFLGKSAILFPLYWWADPTKFGWVTVALKIPPLLLAVYLTWIFLAKAPPPINVIAEMEAEEAAEKAAEEAAKAARAADGAAVDGAAVDGAPAEPEGTGPRHRR